MIDRAALLLEDIDASAEALERLARAHEDGVLVAGAAASTQPAAGVAPLLAEAAAPSTRLVFVGLGSSRYAADVVAAELRSRGREAVVELAARDAPTRMRGDELMFAISSSGRTAEVVDIAMTGGPRAIAVTNDPDSPLAAGAETTLLLDAGVERSGVATRTYRATLATLGLVTGVLTVDEVRSAGAAIRTVIEAPAWAEQAADHLDGAESLDVLVDSRRSGAGEQAALMLREGPRLRAACAADAEWSHTAIYTALPGHRVILLGASAYADETAAIVEGRGGATVALGSLTRAAALAVPLPIRAMAGPIERALVESVAVELVAAALWARTRAGSPDDLPGSAGPGRSTAERS